MKQLDKGSVLKQLLWPMSVLILALFLSMTAYAGTATADETTTDDGDTEGSYFSNPAQAAHAAQLSSQVAADDPEVNQAYADYQDALDTFNALETAPTQTDLDALAAAETAYEEALAEKIGVTNDEIAAMRASGMGWGEIAHELGVHPSLLGLGHTKGKANRHGVDKEYNAALADDELAEATVRTTGRGLALGHGKGINSSDETVETSLALASLTTKSAKSAKGRSSVSGAAGLGSGKSNGSANSNAGGNSSNSGKSGKSGNSSSSSSSSGKGNSGNSNGNKGGNSDKGNNGNGKGNSKK